MRNAAGSQEPLITFLYFVLSLDITSLHSFFEQLARIGRFLKNGCDVLGTVQTHFGLVLLLQGGICNALAVLELLIGLLAAKTVLLVVVLRLRCVTSWGRLGIFGNPLGLMATVGMGTAEEEVCRRRSGLGSDHSDSNIELIYILTINIKIAIHFVIPQFMLFFFPHVSAAICTKGK
jgi:hypothetical protein